jgi:Tfp pilus assembly protein PilF
MTPTQVSQLLHEGVAALRQQDLSAARAAFEVVLERTDRKTGRRSTALTRAHAIAYDGLGCVAIAEGNLALAESYIELARQADGQYLGWMPNLARIRELQGEHLQAQALYRVAVQNYPLKARLRNNYGVFLIKQGDLLEGQDQLARGKVVAR